MSKFRVVGVLIVAILFILIVRNWDRQETKALSFTGTTMGTVQYNVKVLVSEPANLKPAIDSVLVALNQSLSTYIPGSEISKFNREDSLRFESDLFYPILEKTDEVVRETGGAFDPTIGPLVNAWGFGPGKLPLQLDSAIVDSLRSYVGFNKIEFDQTGAIKQTGMYLDMSAIAKGYAVDLVAQMVEDRGIVNYLVEIGGEVRVRGENEKGVAWSIGIEDPLVAREERKVFAIVALENLSLATSGNYRNFYEQDGKLVAHIIDPRTGYNNFRRILSASVFAPDCMTADAYATAFMVMGIDASAKLTKAIPQLESILIYQEDGKLKSWISPGMEAAVKMVDSEDVE